MESRRDDPERAGAAARGARRANRRLEVEWIVIPAIVAVVFLIVFGARLLLG
jgi:hypothetical protein